MTSPWKLKRVTDGQEYVLQHGRNTVGRSMGHTVTLPILCVSRDHCVIYVDDEQVTMIDGPEGVNGTFVGYRRIIQNQPHVLKSGDIIGFGCINRDRIVPGYENAMFKLLNAIEAEAVVPEVVIELISEDEVDVNADNVPINDVIELSDNENDTKDSGPNPLNNEDNRVEGNENFEEPEFVKEEYNVGDDDQIECVSDSEDDDWAARLSQSSPGKALTRRNFESDDFEELPLVKNKDLDEIDASKINTDVKIVSKIYLEEDDDEGTRSEDAQFPNIEEQMEALHSSQKWEEELHETAERTVFPSPELPADIILADKIELAPTINISEPVEKMELSASLPEIVSNKVEAEAVESNTWNGTEKVSAENAPLVSTYIQAIPSYSGNNLKLQSDQSSTNLKRAIVDAYPSSGPSPKRKKRGRSRTAEATGPKKGAFREERNKRLKEIADREKAKNGTMNLESTSTSKVPSTSVSVKITNSNRGNFLTESEFNEKKEKRKLSSSSTSSAKSDRSDADKPQTNDELKDAKKSVKKFNTLNTSKEGNKSDNKRRSRSKSVDGSTTGVKSRREDKKRDDESSHKVKSKHRSRSKNRNSDSSTKEDNTNCKSKKKDTSNSRSRKENKYYNNSREGDVRIDESNIDDRNCLTSINKDGKSEEEEQQSYDKSKIEDEIDQQSKNLKKSNLESRKADLIINNYQKGDIRSDESKQENKNALESKNEEKTSRNPREPSHSDNKSQKEKNNNARKEHISSDKPKEEAKIDNESINEHNIICDPRIQHHNNGNATNEEYKRKGEESEPGTSSSREFVRVNDEKRAPLRDMVPNVVPVKIKTKKSVRFSSEPKVIEFQIEQGNKMKKMSECKTINHSTMHLPCERRFLAFILRWSTKWFEEQLLVSTPPDILPLRNEPMTVCHAFESYDQYERILGDLLLMEVWENLTKDYMRKRGQPHSLQLRLEVPPEVSVNNKIPISLSVNLSLPKKEPMPRMGEIMLIMAESQAERKLELFKHPFYVHNVRMLPAPRNNVNNFLSITLLTVNTQSLSHLQCGAVLLGKTLSYIKNELVLVEAIEELKWSPLTPIILNPEPAHFGNNCQYEVEPSPWTESLNPSQLRAVKSSVGAALSKQPSIQMIQGPPGTGKSSVICSTLMSYLYREGRRQAGRGKVLVCATSNAAVDGLVVRLLGIRQTLPPGERFRMVRVGRVESMHARARDVSSLQLARQHALATRAAAQRSHTPALAQNAMEINFLEAKMNSIRQRLELERSRGTAGAPALEQRLEYYRQRMDRARLASNMNDEPTPGELADAERVIIECSDIVVTTLASVANNRLKCLMDRIALCIVEEAGQAIEPETLMPLMLHVTNLTLIGDPQQLPGYIASQRAKQYGLGESLFSRLSAVTEDWSENPVILLDVQYRMHPAIADYPNRAFYRGLVRDSASVRVDMPLQPYTMVFIANGAQGRGGESRANELEAWGVARLAAELSTLTRQLAMDLAVITPYNAQKLMIQNCLGSLLDRESGGLEVNTVDSFQGQERDVVVVSLARSQGVGFLTDPGRINVMLTRARHALVVCLNPHALLQNNQWRSLIDDAKNRSRCIELPNRVCRPANAETAGRDRILHLLYK